MSRTYFVSAKTFTAVFIFGLSHNGSSLSNREPGTINKSKSVGTYNIRAPGVSTTTRGRFLQKTARTVKKKKCSQKTLRRLKFVCKMVSISEFRLHIEYRPDVYVPVKFARQVQRRHWAGPEPPQRPFLDSRSSVFLRCSFRQAESGFSNKFVKGPYYNIRGQINSLRS